MKCSALLPQVALVLAVAYACSDSTAPAISNAVAAVTQRASDIGKQPPPPVSTVIAISIASPGAAIFTGVFFNNGLIHDDGTAETSTGMAWLRLDNNQLTPYGTASPNTRFMVKDLGPPTGMGTISFLEDGDVLYKIVQVTNFTRFDSCGAPVPGVTPNPCASITFWAEVVDGPSCNLVTYGEGCHFGHAEAYDKASCLVPDSGGGFHIDPSCVPEEIT